jgi:IS1 family transposase
MHNIGMNRLNSERRTQIIRSLVEGNSIRATCRMTDTAKGTVLRLLREIGEVCAEYQDRQLRNLPCQRIQCDEIWSFCYSKEKNVPEEHEGELGYGDVWTWTALCADTKLVPSWLLGRRDAETALAFMRDLASRLAHRVQLTTDGLRAYMTAVEGAFGGDVDYAMLVKLYGPSPQGGQTRYSPAPCVGAECHVIQGNPDKSRISTSYVERQNLTMRMSMRRFTRLTNAFSKKLANLEAALALHYMHYNFCRVHKTLGTTPAVAAGVADHVWTVEEIVGLLEEREKLVASK